MRTIILGVPIDTYSKKEALNKLKLFLSEDKFHILITPNPEIILQAKKDKELFKIIKNADLVVPDGIGVVIASKFNKIKIKERVAGYDLVQDLFNYIKDTSHTVYFLGGKKSSVEEAKIKMEKKYKGLKIVGTNDGYFDQDKEKNIIEEIKILKPDILLVGLGCPKQEKWVYKYKNILPIKLACCIGGSFDGMSGNVKRAPLIFQKIGLEWFYRLVKQPSRFFRMLNLPLFMILVIKEKILRTKK